LNGRFHNTGCIAEEKLLRMLRLHWLHLKKSGLSASYQFATRAAKVGYRKYAPRVVGLLWAYSVEKLMLFLEPTAASIPLSAMEFDRDVGATSGSTNCSVL
jgi:hypothetical protein